MLEKDLPKLINFIRDMDILFFDEYARKNSEILNIYGENVINDSLIEDALKNSVINLVKSEIKRGFSPTDHFFRPECLAYALENGLLFEEEIKQIDFDQKTPETFVERYKRKNFLSNLKEELLNPKPLLNFSSWDSHFCCSYAH